MGGRLFKRKEGVLGKGVILPFLDRPGGQNVQNLGGGDEKRMVTGGDANFRKERQCEKNLTWGNCYLYDAPRTLIKGARKTGRKTGVRSKLIGEGAALRWPRGEGVGGIIKRNQQRHGDWYGPDHTESYKIKKREC